MKKILSLLTFFLLLTVLVNAQNIVADSTYQVDSPPEFKDGLQGYGRFMERMLDRDLPKRRGAPQGIYTIIVRFTVNTDGTVSDITTDNDPGYETAGEVKRVIRMTSKKWTPAKLNNQPIAYRTYRRISFMIF
jgi:periplasmic protein TonB